MSGIFLVPKGSLVVSRHYLQTGRPLAVGTRADGWWIPDHKPGRVPKTEADRKRAAAKYGLRPQDYKAYDPTTEATGDYPDLGRTTYDHRDPYDNWSHSQYRRNWGEPLYWHWDKYRPDRITFTGLEGNHQKPQYGVPLFFAFIGAVVLFFYLSNKSKLHLRPMTMPKQYPFDYYRAWPFGDSSRYPIANYSFEPAESAFDDHEHEHEHEREHPRERSARRHL